jgi:hypothetical protein
MPQAQVFDQAAVLLDVRLLHVLEKATPPSDHLEQASAAVVILLMSVEVALQIVDSSREDSYLDRVASTIVVVQLVLLDNFFLDDRHTASASSRVSRCKGSESAVPQTADARFYQPVS